MRVPLVLVATWVRLELVMTQVTLFRCSFPAVGNRSLSILRARHQAPLLLLMMLLVSADG